MTATTSAPDTSTTMTATMATNGEGGDENSNQGNNSNDNNNTNSSSNNNNSMNSKEVEEEEDGGPLWRAAQEEARRMEPLQVMPNSDRQQQQGRISRFREAFAKRKAAVTHSLKAKTRSRAFVDDMPGNTESGSISTANTGYNNNNNNNNEAGLLGDGLSSPHFAMAPTPPPPSSSSSSAMLSATGATKRVKVVQLLMFGMMGVIGGFFGSVFCQSSCHFATARVDLDAFSDVDDEYTVSHLDLHYGMWKYTPLDSAYHQYAYCEPYEQIEGDGTDTPPVVARSLGLVALLGGTLALMVLWTYLLSGYTTDILWKLAIVLMILSAMSQALTFTLFATELCQVYTCSLGPAAVASICATALWMVTAYEMYHNAPPSSVIMATSAALRLQQQECNGWEYSCCCCCCRNAQEARYTQTVLKNALWDYYQSWWSGSTTPAQEETKATTTAAHNGMRAVTPDRETPLSYSHCTPPSSVLSSSSGRFTPLGRYTPTGHFTPSPSPSLSAVAKRHQPAVALAVRKQQEFAQRQKLEEEGGLPEPFQYQPPSLELETTAAEGGA